MSPVNSSLLSHLQNSAVHSSCIFAYMTAMKESEIFPNCGSDVWAIESLCMYLHVLFRNYWIIPGVQSHSFSAFHLFPLQINIFRINCLEIVHAVVIQLIVLWSMVSSVAFVLQSSVVRTSVMFLFYKLLDFLSVPLRSDMKWECMVGTYHCSSFQYSSPSICCIYDLWNSNPSSSGVESLIPSIRGPLISNARPCPLRKQCRYISICKSINEIRLRWVAHAVASLWPLRVSPHSGLPGKFASITHALPICQAGHFCPPT